MAHLLCGGLPQEVIQHLDILSSTNPYLSFPIEVKAELILSNTINQFAIKREVLQKDAKPLVFTDIKVKTVVFTSTPFKIFQIRQ